MYPIYPTIDLKETNIYDLSQKTVSNFSTDNIHTLIYLNDDDFTVDQDLSRLIMLAFGAAYAQFSANKKENNQIDGRLKEPIVLNAISLSNHNCLSFVTYQLNTVDLADNKGVKNICFYDVNNEIYADKPRPDQLPYLSHRNLQRLAIRKLNYNPIVFNKLYALISSNSN